MTAPAARGPLAGAFASSARAPFERGFGPYVSMMLGILAVPFLGSMAIVAALAVLGVAGALILGNGSAAFFIALVLPTGAVTIGLCLLASPIVVALAALLVRAGRAGQASATVAGAITGTAVGLTASVAFGGGAAGLLAIFGYLLGAACGLAGRARLVAHWPEIAKPDA